MRFRNEGNVHLVPRGVSEVRDPWGRVVARAAINDSSSPVLPESFRRYQAPLTGIEPAWMPGRYSLVTTYRYDGTERTQEHIVQVWYAGLLVVWLVGIGALVASGLLGWWLWRRHRRS